MKTKFKVRSKFYWKKLSVDGLLKTVKRDWYYEWTETLGSCGYDTKEEAYQDLIQWGYLDRGFVLIEECGLVEED